MKQITTLGLSLALAIGFAATASAPDGIAAPRRRHRRPAT